MMSKSCLKILVDPAQYINILKKHQHFSKNLEEKIQRANTSSKYGHI